MFQRQLFTACSLACFIVTMAVTASADENWAAQMFSQTKFDFGPVAKHSDCQGYLEFTNKFSPVMEVDSVSTSCRCITASTETRSIAPKETGRIKLVLDTSHFSGQRNVTLTVKFRFDHNGTQYQTINIPCTAYIRTDIWMQPNYANFGSLSVGTGGEQRVKVTRTDNDLWRIQEVRSRNSAITTELKELSRGNGKVEYEVLVKISKDAPLGNIQDSLTLVTNDSSNSNVALRVDGKVEADIVAMPDRIPLGKLTPGKEARYTLVVKSKKPIRIEKVDFTQFPGHFKATPSTEEKTVHVIPVTLTAPDVMGDLKETVKISFEGRSDQVTIQANGTVSALTTAGAP